MISIWPWSRSWMKNLQKSLSTTTFLMLLSTHSCRFAPVSLTETPHFTWVLYQEHLQKITAEVITKTKCLSGLPALAKHPVTALSVWQLGEVQWTLEQETGSKSVRPSWPQDIINKDRIRWRAVSKKTHSEIWLLFFKLQDYLSLPGEEFVCLWDHLLFPAGLIKETYRQSCRCPDHTEQHKLQLRGKVTTNIPATAGRLNRRPAEQRKQAADQPPGPSARG